MILGRNNRKRSSAALALLAMAALVAALLPAVTASAQISGGIEFINPGPRDPRTDPTGSEHTNIMSDRTAGGSNAYRIAAWVDPVPADPVVEFEIVLSAIDIRVIGTAVRADDNVWELLWDIPDIRDGEYVLRAKLFSGFTQVGQDEQVVQIRDGEADSSTAAPRARIVGLQQGGLLGFYRRPDRDVFHTLIPVVTSSGTTRVRGFYTTTPVGQQPEWVGCANESAGGAANGLHCTLEANIDPMTVTAVAAVANDNETPIFPTTDDAPDDQAGDAIHVTPYIQIPSQVIPSEPVATEAEDCPRIRMQVLDQSSMEVPLVNVDFHAVGPSDNLRWDVGSLATILLAPDAFPPDQGSHTYEQGYDCAADRISPDPGFEQGQHDRPVLADIKHIETGTGGSSSSGGTDDDGFESEFIRSPDEGETHITAWADLNGDDEWSTGEPCAATSVTWFGDEERPPVTPVAEFQGCTIAAPGQGPQPPAAGQPADAELQPDQQSAPPGETATFTAEVRDSSGRPVPNEPVEWESSGEGRIVSADERTDENGRARVEVTSDNEGEQQITVRVPRCAEGADCTDTSTMTWAEGEPVESGPCRGHRKDSRTAREDGTGFVVVGTDDDDVLEGTSGDDIICGLGGNDTIDGLAGDDLIAGGGGKDTARGGSGNDELRGGNKNDLLVGGADDDELKGQRGFDTLKGNAGDDRLVGNAGNDVLQGGGGNDLLKGGKGKDLIKAFTGDDHLRGGDDDDILKGHRGNDRLRGNAGNDFLDGGPNRDSCNGGRGSDSLRNCER